MKSNANSSQVVGLIFMTLGLIMLAVVGYLLASHYKFTQRAISVTGTVIGYNNQLGRGDDSGMYSPMFEYSVNGIKRTYQSHSSSSSPEFEIGDTVEILVDPNDAQSVMVNSFLERWLAPSILGFLGALFTGLGYVVYRVFDRQ